MVESVEYIHVLEMVESVEYIHVLEMVERRCLKCFFPTNFSLCP